MDGVHIIYDFSVMPVTFDGIVALCCAVSFAKSHKSKAFCIHFLRHSFRKRTDRDLAYDDDTKKWRSNNILIRGAGLISGVSQVNIMDHRDLAFFPKDAIIFPKSWRNDKPTSLPYNWKTLLALNETNHDFRLLKSGDEAKRIVQNYFSKKKKNISLSIRSADFRKARDAQIQDWVGLFHHLESIGYHCIIIPDHSSATSGTRLPFPIERVITSAAIDLELRLAVYESCYGNLSWTGGHASVLWLSHASFLNFGSLNAASYISNEKYWADHGISTKRNIPFFLKNQIYDWREASTINLDYLINRSCCYLENLNV